MSESTVLFQPGVMLHEAIVGAFKAAGGSFERFCKENGITPTNARSATYGIMKGPRGKALLAQLIAAAGPAVVEAGYLARVQRHTEELKKGAA